MWWMVPIEIAKIWFAWAYLDYMYGDTGNMTPDGYLVPCWMDPEMLAAVCCIPFNC